MMLFKSIRKVIEIIYKEAEKELYDETPCMEALDDLFARFNSNKITEEEYEIEEDIILKRLKEIREYRKEHEMREE